MALARSLAKRPRLLLLDEPLGALDKKLREQTQIELVNIVREVGVTCVMVTHDQEEAMTMATRIAVMSAGQFAQVGTPSEIYESPASRLVAEFVGSANLMPGTLQPRPDGGSWVTCADCTHHVAQRADGASGARVHVALRPEKIHLSPAAPTAPTALGSDGDEVNQTQGTICGLTYFGSATTYRVALPSGWVLQVSASNAAPYRTLPLSVGDPVWASWSSDAAVVLAS